MSSKIAIFEDWDGVPGADAIEPPALPAPAPRQRRRGYKRAKTSSTQAARQSKFKGCVRNCKGTGRYRICMSTCLKKKTEVKSDPEDNND